MSEFTQKRSKWPTVVGIVVGLLLLTGLWEELNRWVQTRLVSGFEVAL